MPVRRQPREEPAQPVSVVRSERPQPERSAAHPRHRHAHQYAPRAALLPLPGARKPNSAGSRGSLELPIVAYVITQPCIGVKDASCVEVCPVDCIHTDDAADMYYIDPDECIDCGACVDPCPVDAIYPEDEVPGDQTQFIKINADYFNK